MAAPATGSAAAPAGEGGAANPAAEASGGERGGAPRPQVVQVKLPNGTTDVRLAQIDREAGQLILWQLTHSEGGEVEVGGQASIQLASIGDAAFEDSCVLLRAGGPSGVVLLRLGFSDAALARTWALAIRSASTGVPEASQPAGASTGRGEGRGEGEQGPSGEDRRAAELLRSLLEHLQQQVALLEAINGRKEEHLLQLQGEMEWALEQLHAGQREYAEQQRTLDSQQRTIEGLQQRLRAANAAEAACAANAMNAAAGAAAAARAGATGPVARVAPAAAAAGNPFEGSSVAPTRSPAADTGAAGGGEALVLQAAGAAAQLLPFDREAELHAQRALLQKLRALEAEKGRLERELREERGEIAAQFADLQGMMEALELEA